MTSEDVPASFDPDSSTIAHASYNATARVMRVTFKRKGAEQETYTYDGVPIKLWLDFIGSTSAGSFFATQIRPLYSGKRV